MSWSWRTRSSTQNRWRSHPPWSAGALHQDISGALVRVGSAAYACRLSATEGVEIQPLWLWTDNAKLRPEVQKLLLQPFGNTRHVGARQIDAPVELDTSLTSGPLSARIDAAAGVVLGARSRTGRRAGLLKDAIAWKRLARALLAPTNRGEKRDRVRRTLLEYITEFDVPEQEQFLLERLDEESAELRAVAYPGMIALGHDSFLRYLNQRYCEGDSNEQGARGGPRAPCSSRAISSRPRTAAVAARRQLEKLVRVALLGPRPPQ